MAILPEYVAPAFPVLSIATAPMAVERLTKTLELVGAKDDERAADAVIGYVDPVDNPPLPLTSGNGAHEADTATDAVPTKFRA